MPTKRPRTRLRVVDDAPPDEYAEVSRLMREAGRDAAAWDRLEPRALRAFRRKHGDQLGTTLYRVFRRRPELMPGEPPRVMLEESGCTGHAESGI